MPLCNRTLVACLAGMLLLGGCSSTATRHESTAKTGQPQPLPADYEKALVLMRSGDYGAAIPVLQAFSAEHPELAGPHINLGIAYARMKDNDAAMAALNKGVELNAGNAAAYLQRGILYREKGDFQAALSDYQQALKLQPDYALAHRNIGILYDLYLQQPGEALAHYKRYLQLLGGEDKTVNGWVIDLERRTGSAHASVTP